MHRNRLERPAEEPDDRNAEQRRLGEERDPPRSQAKQERGIDEPAGMIQHEDDRAARRYPLGARYLDASEEYAEDQPEERAEERPHGDGSAPAVRSPRQAAYIQMTPLTSTATGMINTASPSVRASESAPTSDGDGTSPRT